MESEGWKMEPRFAKVARGKSRVYEDRPPYRSGSIVSVAQIPDGGVRRRAPARALTRKTTEKKYGGIDKNNT